MIINFLNTHTNRYLFQNNNYKRNISFGLNSNNEQAIMRLHQCPEDKISAINSFDMDDPEIQPCLDEFRHMICEEPSDSTEMNAILAKLDTLSNKQNTNGLKDCLSCFCKYWIDLFLSTRVKASKVMDKIKMEHPDVGHLSRTATNPLYRDIAIKNIDTAQKYIIQNTKKGVCPDKDMMINLHKIITTNIPLRTADGREYDSSFYSGIIEKSKEDRILLPTEDKKCDERLDLFMAWLNRNYNKDNVYLLAAQSYKKLLGICPFYDANGRTIRAFIDALLYSRGYCIAEYPSNYTEVRGMKMEDLSALYEDNCKKIND